jgi:hypothetical protein
MRMLTIESDHCAAEIHRPKSVVRPILSIPLVLRIPELLLVLASTMILRSECHWIHELVLQCDGSESLQIYYNRTGTPRNTIAKRSICKPFAVTKSLRLVVHIRDVTGSYCRKAHFRGCPPSLRANVMMVY